MKKKYAQGKHPNSHSPAVFRKVVKTQKKNKHPWRQTGDNGFDGKYLPLTPWYEQPAYDLDAHLFPSDYGL